MSEFGFFFFLRIAVAVSSTAFLSAPDESLRNLSVQVASSFGKVVRSLQIDLARLLPWTLWFCRHADCSAECTGSRSRK